MRPTAGEGLPCVFHSPGRPVKRDRIIKRGCCTAPSSDTLEAYRSIDRILLKIKDFPGAKSARYEFSLPDGKLTSAKILLGPAKPPLRI